MVKQEEIQYLKPINPKKVLGKHSRRQFLRNLGLASVVGGATAVGVHEAGKSVEDYIVGGIAEREKEIRALVVNFKAVSGALERKIASQTAELEKNYISGNLRMYEQLGIATPVDISDIEKIIATNKEFERYYGVTERLRELKDRADKSIADFEAAESKLPKAQQSLNDKIRGLFGKPTGQKGYEARQSIRDRLTSLVTVYDTNENNKRGESAVLERLNQELSKQNISQEEREFLTYFRAEFEASPDKRNFLETVRNYAPGDRKQAVERLRQTIEEGEKIFEKVKENKEYITRMQGLLKDGISLQENIRKQSAQQFQARKQELDQSIYTLKSQVDGVITDLKSKGYEIETREDEINRGTFTREVAGYFDPLVKGVATTAGLLVGGVAYLWGRKRVVARAGRNATAEVARKYNSVVPQYNHLLKARQELTTQNQTLAQELEKYKNPQEQQTQEKK